jgi:hypothetical protein
MAAVNEKVPVGREDLAVFLSFRHADQTRVGQAHRLILVFAQESCDIREVDGEVEIQDYELSPEQFQERF